MQIKFGKEKLKTTFVAEFKKFGYMNEKEKKIVMEIAQLYDKLCSLTYDGSHGAHRMLPPSVNHYVRLVEEIYNRLKYLYDTYKPFYLSLDNVHELNDICRNELRELRCFNSLSTMNSITSQISSIITCVLNIIKG